MSPRGNKSNGKPTSKVSHFRTADTTFANEHNALLVSTRSSSSSSSSSHSGCSSRSDCSSRSGFEVKPPKPKLSKAEQFEAKYKKLANGVGKSNRKLTPKEKKCLKKEQKKVEKMEMKIKWGEKAMAEQQPDEVDEFVVSCEDEDEK